MRGALLHLEYFNELGPDPRIAWLWRIALENSLLLLSRIE